MLFRAMQGLVVAAAISVAGYRLRALSASGVVAATLVGASAVAAGWDWATLLILFFVSSSLLTRWRARTKAERSGSIVEKGGPRDVTQVLANGALFAASGVLTFFQSGSVWPAFGLGCLAAATSDTWGTEVGTALSGQPRSVMTGRRVTPGTSGAVSLVGLMASLAGAVAMSAAGRLLDWPPRVAWSALVGGCAGALIDTLLGAAAQERRACPACNLATERLVHDCGSPTSRTGGIPGFRNDWVNLTSSALGGLTAIVVQVGA